MTNYEQLRALMTKHLVGQRDVARLTDRLI